MASRSIHLLINTVRTRLPRLFQPSLTQYRLLNAATGLATASKWAQVGLAVGVAGGVGLTVYYTHVRRTASCLQKELHDGAVEASPASRTFSLDEISKHKTKETGIWVTFGDSVYDITEFVEQHPGGSEKIMLAAGKALEPYWTVFAQHNTDQVKEILEEMRIGEIVETDRNRKTVPSSREGPYANEPQRSPILLINTHEPFNAETPTVLLSDNFLTPNDYFYVRNHLPVPTVDPDAYVLQITGEGLKPTRLTLNDLKSKFPKRTVTATIQCAGNRRTDLGSVREVKGIPWKGGAIGNAEWSGVYLRDVLNYAGYKDDVSSVEHIHLEGLDNNPITGEHSGASIPIEKALDPRGDCLLAYEMNGEPLPRDHGYPLRAVIPGIVGARNVKWLGKIVTSREEYDGLWQQRDYKGFSPSVNWSNVDFSSAPAIQEMPVQSFISSPQDGSLVDPGAEKVTLKGIAWSGGGRAVVRVDVSVDGGKSWHVAKLQEGSKQPLRRAWAWTIWEATVPVAADTRELEVCCKAVDVSYNVQPDTAAPIWNLRGCLSNAWHRIHVKVAAN